MLNSPLAALPAVSPVAPATPPAAASPGNPGNAGAASDPGAFARQLERAHAGEGRADGRPEGRTEGAAQAQAATDTAAARTRMDNERLQRQARQDKAEKAGTRTPEARAQAGAQASGDKASAAADATEVGSADGDDATSTPATDAAVLLASLLNRAVPAGTAARGSADAARNAADSRRTPAEVGGVAAGAAGAAEATEAADGNGNGSANATALRASRDGTGPALQPAGTEPPAFTLPAGSALPGQQAAAAAHAPTQDMAATPAPYAAQIQAPVDSPDFAPGLSAQVSVMLRDGLQEARLQLNPAEMGPITVQIQIDGSTAQVTMTAEQAPTRNALEQAMPSLAGALREEGLTLTGGGVFEQPRQAQGDAAPAPQAGTRGSGNSGQDSDGVPAAPVRATAPRGIVDVFA